LVNEAELDVDDTVVVYRGGRRFIESWNPVRLPPGEGLAKTLKAGGTYLITGGLGAFGPVLIKNFRRDSAGKSCVSEPKHSPPRENWERFLESSDGNPQLRDRLEQLLAIKAAGAEVMIAQTRCD
jgi:hypothetical protein